MVNITNSVQTRQFNCSADGIPRPSILWRRDGLLILPNNRISINNLDVPDNMRNIRVVNISEIQQSYSVLTITNLRETDGGEYTCRADNSAGVADILKIPYTLNVTYCKS